MNRKINFFTLLIFAYSVLVCVTCKKESNSNIFTNLNSKNKTHKTVIPADVEEEKVTASAAHIHNAGQ